MQASTWDFDRCFPKNFAKFLRMWIFPSQYILVKKLKKKKCMDKQGIFRTLSNVFDEAFWGK